MDLLILLQIKFVLSSKLRLVVPMKLPKPYKNEGETSKYPEYTDTKVFDYIPRDFVAYKMFFFSDRSCFFSATVNDW
jgi:hypothetical protein